MNGTPKFAELKFTILVDELAPTLKAQRLNFDAVGTARKRKLEFSLLAVGVLVTLFGLVLFKVIYDSWIALPKFEGGVTSFLTQIGLSGVTVRLAVLPAFLLTLLGALISAAAMFDGRFPPSKKKFVLPEGLAKSRFWFAVREGVEEP